MKVKDTKRKVLLFGKIAYLTSQKVNEVEIDIELYPNGKGCYTLSICGIIWNKTHKGEKCSGQCLDIIKQYINDPLYNEIYDLWKKYQMRDASFIPEKDLNRIEEIISSC